MKVIIVINKQAFNQKSHQINQVKLNIHRIQVKTVLKTIVINLQKKLSFNVIIKMSAYSKKMKSLKMQRLFQMEIIIMENS